MPKNTTEQQTLTASENSLSLYDLAEIVYSILKNDKGKWQSVQQYAEKYAGLWVDKVEPNSHFANQILEEVVGIMPYNTSYLPALERFYKEFEQAFGIKIKGNAEPFLVRLTNLIRKAILDEKFSLLNKEYQRKHKVWEKMRLGEGNEGLIRDELTNLSRELDRFYKLTTRLEVLLAAKSL